MKTPKRNLAMASDDRTLQTWGTYVYPPRRRRLRSYREQAPESEASDDEAAANTVELQPQSTAAYGDSPPNLQPLLASSVVENPLTAINHPAARDRSPRGQRSRRSLFTRNRRRGGRGPATSPPSRGNTARRRGSIGNSSRLDRAAYDHGFALALEQDQDFIDEEVARAYTDDQEYDYWRTARTVPMGAVGRSSPPEVFGETLEEPDVLREGRLARLGSRLEDIKILKEDSPAFDAYNRDMTGSAKRSRDRFEAADGRNILRTLNDRAAVAVILYRNAPPNPDANDIWPQYRSAAKLPARFYLIKKTGEPLSDPHAKRRPLKTAKRGVGKGTQIGVSGNELLDAPVGRPKWNLPVELVELIAGYLNRDDIKSLRMVSHELNYYVSQVIFKTAVVPFNTEIYGMLAQGQKPDLKGKKRAKLGNPIYSWKNGNGDEVYNGHGLDVFKGFGRHIQRYGMSFEVNETSLAQPPAKTLTEKKTSFWGNYNWPFGGYRRFDAVAGLETAADETPRMTIAFSELTRVKQLALSVDSGLGWLNGPDRSIRARILQRPPAVFGTLKDVPDRRAQAQQELWRHIENLHQDRSRDIKLATLYRLEALRPLSEIEEASTVAEEQSEMSFLDTHLINEAIPHNTDDLPLPTSFDDPEVLERFVLSPVSPGTGVLFTSDTPPSDAAQIMSPIIPANLTKAQKEWLLETEWAQRASMSSYVLSIIDNPITFAPVHTLNISRLSDRYLPMLNRNDFWDALPDLTNLTLLVIPGWRNVYKDEAGFVETPRINPVNGHDSFCELLQNHVASRSGIRKLTIGWIGGGEQAEGLHARNKLIMPVPLLPLGVDADDHIGQTSSILTELDPERLRTALLHFPHIETLTLKNCWITPSALLQFVKIHDSESLKKLILNSVSLTAVLRPNNNANQAVPQGGALVAAAPALAALFGAGAMANAFNNNAGGQAGNQANVPQLMNNNQLLQWLIQTLQGQLLQMQANAVGVQQQNQITAVQTQLQQLQQMQNPNQQQGQAPGQLPALNLFLPNVPAHGHNVANQLAVTALAAQAQAIQQAPNPSQQQIPANAQLLHSQPREGSWTSIIDLISPGTNPKDFNSDHSKADPARQTSLQSIEFISCGYAKLPYATIDQAAIDQGLPLLATTRNTAFTKRYSALAPAMLSSKWAHLGEIVQELDAVEMAVLDFGWNLKFGWEDAEEARAAEFDGLLPGGTGRFTGILRASDRMSNIDESGS